MGQRNFTSGTHFSDVLGYYAGCTVLIGFAFEIDFRRFRALFFANSFLLGNFLLSLLLFPVQLASYQFSLAQ